MFLKIIKNSIPLYLLLLLSVCTKAQTVIIKETVPDDFEASDFDFGPNRRTYNHPYLSYGTFANVFDHTNGAQESAAFGRSIDFASGTRGYANFTKIYGLTFDSYLSFRNFGIQSNQNTLYPVSSENLTSSKYWLTSFGLAIGNQINLKPKRGNQLGTYFNIGAYGNVNIIRRFVANYSKNDIIPFDAKIVLKKFNEMRLLDYGVMLKFGKSNVTFFAKYRMSAFFKNTNFILNELPRLTFGIEVFAGHI